MGIKNNNLLKTYDTILNSVDATPEKAIIFAANFIFDELEATEEYIGHCVYVNTVGGIGVYYDYAADYYFFTDERRNQGTNIILNS